jgi:hypothetical protein
MANETITGLAGGQPSQPQDDNVTTPQGDSRAFGVTIHGWIAIIVIFSVCEMSIMRIPITEPLYTIAAMVVAFYFGQKKQAS